MTERRAASEREDGIELEGVPCPVPNCQGYVKETTNNPRYPYACEYGHVLELVGVSK